MDNEPAWKSYYYRNIERCRRNRREYFLRKKEQLGEKGLAKYFSETSKKWRAKNPEKAKAIAQRAVKKKAEKVRLAWIARQKAELNKVKTCGFCGAPYRSKYENSVYCSTICSGRRTRRDYPQKPLPPEKRAIRTCLICSAAFNPYGRQKCCGDACLKKHKTALRTAYSKTEKFRAARILRMKLMPSDHPLKLKQRISTCLRAALEKQRHKKNTRTVMLLGCSIQHVKAHLESKFTKGMTWQNMGRNGWHIDHIIPTSSFNLATVEEQKKAFHWTNLQPLWEAENIRKSNKMPDFRHATQSSSRK